MPSLKGGGAERVLINIFKLIDLDKYEIDLFLGISGGVLEKDVPKEIKIKYIFPNRLMEKLVYLVYRKLGLTIPFYFYGRKIRDDYQVGLSFLDSFYSEFLFQNKAKIKKKVVVIHSSYQTYKSKSKNLKGKHFLRLKQRYSKIDIIISVAHEALAEFKNIFGEYKDMRVIYNPINVKDVLAKSKSEEAINLNKNIINIIAVGSHIPVKGYDRLINSCAQLKNEGLDFNLNILGDGYLKRDHQSLIDKLELADTIFLKDFVNNPYKWIEESDIFVMTSYAEGLPTALCEAIVLKKPVMVTNVPGCREVVADGTYGLIVDNSIDAITEGLRKLITNDDIRMDYIKRSLERSKIFEDKIAVKKYTEIFDC